MRNICLLTLVLLVACADDNDYNGISPLDCRDLIPLYTPGDTCRFVSDSGKVKKIKIASVKDTFYYDYAHKQNIEAHEINFLRIKDPRVFKPFTDNGIHFQNGQVTIYWENCTSSFQICRYKQYVNHMLINGKDYANCVAMRNFCHDTANPIRVIYDIKEGIVSYTDSSGTRWDLVPK